MARKWKIVRVEQRYIDPHSIPREFLSCGHIRTDPALYYEGETAFQIKRLAEKYQNEKPRARCYECAKDQGR